MTLMGLRVKDMLIRVEEMLYLVLLLQTIYLSFSTMETTTLETKSNLMDQQLLVLILQIKIGMIRFKV